MQLIWYGLRKKKSKKKKITLQYKNEYKNNKKN